MFLKVAFVVGILGHFSKGVPLESPSSDVSKFFEERIIGGSDAPKCVAPHMTALVVGYIWQSFVCGGSIITERHVLTAAHCVFVNWDGTLLDTFHAIIGTNTWHKGIIVEFKDFMNHPEYDAWNIKYDVGVLFTKKKIEIGNCVAVIALNYEYVGGGEESFVAGWGTLELYGEVPDKLQILYLSTISSEECIEKAEDAAQGWWSPRIDPKLEICTYHSPGYGMCHGDSGSPLVSLRCGRQSGIVSWGWPCAIGGPDVFVRIRGVKKFIEDAIKSLCGKHTAVTHGDEPLDCSNF